MSDAKWIGDVDMINVDPFDGGKRAVVSVALKKEVEIDGKTTRFLGFVTEEPHLLQLVDGLNKVAVAREAVIFSERILKPH